MTSRIKAALANFLLLGVAAIAGLSAGEIGLRLFRPQPLESAYMWPDRTLRHVPGLDHVYSRQEFSNRVVYNSDGLRGREIPASRRPGGIRVLFIGDSFVEGKQVGEEEVLTAAFERLAGAAGIPVEVINAGVGGTGTAEELILWERFGRTLKPDVVVLGFYANDVRNNVDHGLYGLRDGRAIPLKDPPLPNARWIYDARKFLASRSHLYMLVKESIEAAQARRRTGRRQDPSPPDGVVATRATAPPAPGRKAASLFAAADDPLESEEVFARVPLESVERGWNLTLALLDDLKRSVEAVGARFAIVVLPTRFQVDDARWEAHAAAIGVDPAAFDLRKPQSMLGEWSRRTSTPLIDLLDDFRSRNTSNTFFFSIDAHFNAAGHRLAAERILEGLEARGVL